MKKYLTKNCASFFSLFKYIKTKIFFILLLSLVTLLFFPQNKTLAQDKKTQEQGMSFLKNNLVGNSLQTTNKSRVKSLLNIKEVYVLNKILKNGNFNLTENNYQPKQVKAYELIISDLLNKTPMKEMVPYINKQKMIVAGLLVGIASKESAFGKYSPHIAGKNCYNYWGYKGKSKLKTKGGYSCFKNPKIAVETVAKRIEILAINKKLDTPSKMLVWKCGNTCKKHSEVSKNKWVRDVSLYFNKIINPVI